MAETTGPTGHIAGVEITINDRWIRQRCAWCGYVLANYDLTRVAVPIGQLGRPGGWETGAIVMVDGNASWVVEIAGYELPAETCARRETDPFAAAADASPAPARTARHGRDIDGWVSNRCAFGIDGCTDLACVCTCHDHEGATTR